jgi:lipopolysaccharide/colanic/teichoic acid biosynthesis glycosyltransferase
MWGSRSVLSTIAQPTEHVEELADGELGRLYVVGAPSGFYVRAVKPAFDRFVGATALLVALPVMCLCAVAVRISVGKGIFFSQERVGRDGRVFKVYKFRTMHHDRRSRDRAALSAYEGPDRRRTHKHPGDPRLTRVGRFLRKWSLDELPQLWNVVAGDMSVVGPRPELVAVVERYAEWEHARHKVKPGLTGLWQVSARGGGRPMHEHVNIDLQYVARCSAWLDITIIARTPLALLTNRGF